MRVCDYGVTLQTFETVRQNESEFRAAPGAVWFRDVSDDKIDDVFRIFFWRCYTIGNFAGEQKHRKAKKKPAATPFVFGTKETAASGAARNLPSLSAARRSIGGGASKEPRRRYVFA